MLYNSTRNSTLEVESAQAIVKGISDDGGLFVPKNFPKLEREDLTKLIDLSYAQRAKFIFSLFLTDFTDEELDYCVNGAYNTTNFSTDNIAEIVKLNDQFSMLELWHGPTCAFKDMALQVLPYLLTVSSKKIVKDKEIVILVATSGDTGKAALEGFKDVDGTSIIVFYPEDGVSAMQKRQMTTQDGGNVNVCSIKGNFDDAQNGVKGIFANAEIADKLMRKNKLLSSANSINWGRLAPQIIYYISSYVELVTSNEISLGDKTNIVVPTGNFGNILAAYYAGQMGLPIGKLICASNANNVLTDFITTGVYDRNRDFMATISPSMDILISSNLERLLYDMSGKDDAQISSWFDSLAKDGRYEVSDLVKTKLQEQFSAGYCDDEKTMQTIKECFDNYSYLCDTHTAVALSVANDYVKQTGDKTKTVIASTASPYKFAPSVLKALDSAALVEDEFKMLDKIFEISKLPIPSQLSELKNKEVRFNSTIDKNIMGDYVTDLLIKR